ncbi:MAG TPA: O-antigen ligase family protein [Rhabdochlamydiaceae bacterium]|jgi:O-antigen ligase|nr:O-antigen ligase family protein [Rhabdochlamydiaceae bacterium]
MVEKVAAIPLRARLKLEYLLYLLVLLIPFQQRLYKGLRSFSKSLISAPVPEYFEIHLDGFISDFVLVGMIFWCVKKIQWKTFWEQENKYLSLFLLFALISIIHSDFATYLVPYWRWMHLALPAFLFFIVSQIPFSFKKIAQISMAVALIESVLAIAQYFAQHSLGLKGLGEATLLAKHYVGPHFPMGGGSIWLFDQFFHGARIHDFVLRASGTLSHPNILGGFMVFGLLMTYYVWSVSQKRGWINLAILLQTFCLFITYSRAAIFVAAFTTAAWVALTWIREKKIPTLFWVSAASALLSLGLLYPQIFYRGGIVSYNEVSHASDTLRMTVQDVGLAMFKAHPFLGVGFNNYMLTFATFAVEIPATYIHNVYLHLCVETGLFGLLALILFCAFILVKGWKRRQRPEVITCLCIFMGLLLIGMADFYPLCQQEIRIIFFLMAALIASDYVTLPDR